MERETSLNNASAFKVVSQFVAALSAQDTETMKSLHAKYYVVDWVYGDAFENPPSSAEESAQFFPAWFAGLDVTHWRLVIGDGWGVWPGAGNRGHIRMGAK